MKIHSKDYEANTLAIMELPFVKFKRGQKLEKEIKHLQI